MTKPPIGFSRGLRHLWPLTSWSAMLLLAVTILSGVAGHVQPWPFRQGELMLYDIDSSLSPRAPAPRISLVIIGERTLDALGSWPFSRAYHAKLLDQLRLARAVGVDILFPEPSPFSGDDIVLANAIARHGRVVLSAHTKSGGDEPGGRQQTVLPLPALYNAAADIGFTNVDTEVDGLIRFGRPVRSAGGEMLPSLAFAVARQALQDTGEMLGAGRDLRLRLGGHDMPLDRNARLWLAPARHAPPTYEYLDVLRGDVAPETFLDDIVLIGAAASGAADFQIVPTAFGSRVITGVSFNAEELRTLLAGDSIRVGPAWIGAMAAAGLALAAGLIAAWFKPLRGGIAVCLLSLAWASAALLLFVRHSYWIAGFTPALCALIAGTLILLARLASLHDRWRVQVISLDRIVYLNEEEVRRHESLAEYLGALWERVEAETGIRFIGGPLLPEELPEEFARLATTSDGVLLVQSATTRGMAVPLKKEVGVRYALFGWERRMNPDSTRAAAALAISAAWFFRVQKEGQRRRKTLTDTIKAIFTALDYRDPITGGHSTRVSEMCLRIMDHMDLPPQLYEDIYLGALIHDLGKVGIPDAILNKEGKLTREEYEAIRNHPDIARGILASVDLPQAAFDAVYHHHERFDGSGYPQGLKGEEISLAGRIVALADFYDAVSHDRPYRRGMRLEEVVTLMNDGVGRHFDPELLRVFMELTAPQKAASST